MASKRSGLVSGPLRARDSAARYRVNARLDGEARDQLAALSRRTGLSTSEILREAVRRMHDDELPGAAAARGALDQLVGKFAGAPADLSTGYKRYLGEGLAKKHRAS